MRAAHLDSKALQSLGSLTHSLLPKKIPGMVHRKQMKANIRNEFPCPRYFVKVSKLRVTKDVEISLIERSEERSDLLLCVST